MNKELIKKYKKEFDYWVNGGKILMHYGNKWLPVALDAKWEFFISDLEEMRSFGYVIADEYVEFRKALAEGKTIQCNAREEQNDITYAAFGHNWWTDTTEFIYATRFYRIKPEEPEFKIGDWVIVNGPDGTFTECISGIADNTYTLSGTNICYKSQASKWNPTRGEVCIVWDDNILSSPSIIKFDYINDSGQYRATDNTFWDNCMPFEGKLPPHMKDNK